MYHYADTLNKLYFQVVHNQWSTRQDSEIDTICQILLVWWHTPGVAQLQTWQAKVEGSKLLRKKANKNKDKSCLAKGMNYWIESWTTQFCIILKPTQFFNFVGYPKDKLHQLPN